ncbi:hypothetical protein [Thiolapillus sp.]|uniref:hypothetical protein n=1 Tax=Thiolapillus sp. TaxID=2017437 RepID=UPI003AF6E855
MDAYFASPLALCARRVSNAASRLLGTGGYQPSLRSPWLAAIVGRSSMPTRPMMRPRRS